MEKKIYLVTSSEGQYEDYHEWVEKAFVDKSQAEEFAKQLDVLHRAKPEFITEEFANALDESNYEWDELTDDDPKYESPKYLESTQEEKDAFYTWYNNEYIQFLINSMYKKGFFVTEYMLKQHDEWESNSYTDWHNCSVEEITLVE